MYFASFVAATRHINLDTYLGLHYFLAPNDFNIAQLFTYMFMHASLTHLFFNMFGLWMFGRILEQVWGAKYFLFFYMACGVGAGLTQEIVQFIQYGTGAGLPFPEYLDLLNTVGASGAIYGILLGFGMLFPNQPIFIFPLPIPIKAKYFIVGYALLELLLGVSYSSGDGVAHFAHLGGMVVGLIIILYWRRKNRNNGINF